MEELKENIIELCNNSGLPLDAIFFVVKDTLRDIEETIRVYKEKQNEQKEEDNG